jgi:hypothetical protein
MHGSRFELLNALSDQITTAAKPPLFFWQLAFSFLVRKEKAA